MRARTIAIGACLASAATIAVLAKRSRDDAEQLRATFASELPSDLAASTFDAVRLASDRDVQLLESLAKTLDARNFHASATAVRTRIAELTERDAA